MRIFGIIVGVLIALTGLPLLLGGIGLVAWVGDGSGIKIPPQGLHGTTQRRGDYLACIQHQGD